MKFSFQKAFQNWPGVSALLIAVFYSVIALGMFYVPIWFPSVLVFGIFSDYLYLLVSLLSYLLTLPGNLILGVFCSIIGDNASCFKDLFIMIHVINFFIVFLLFYFSFRLGFSKLEQS